VGLCCVELVREEDVVTALAASRRGALRDFLTRSVFFSLRYFFPLMVTAQPDRPNLIAGDVFFFWCSAFLRTGKVRDEELHGASCSAPCSSPCGSSPSA